MKNFYILTLAIFFGFLTHEAQGQKVLFTENFGAYNNTEDLSTNGSGWIHTGVGGFLNKVNSTFGAKTTNCFGQLTGNGEASAHREVMLTSGETYRFSAYLRTTATTTDYSTIRINVGGTDVVTSNLVAVKNVWEEMVVEYTATSDETAMFVIIKSQGQTLNIDKIRITCSSCTNKKFVYDFHDSKESWVSGGGCSLGLNDKGMVLNATNTTPIARSGDLTQDLALNTSDFNKAKITFKTPYNMGGQGYGKFYLYNLADGNSQFATYNFVREETNTTTFQTAEIDLTSTTEGTYSGYIARIGVRAPWGIANNGKAYIQKIELYNDNLVGLKETTNSSYQVKLYPNPTTNSLTLNLDGVSNVNIEFLNLQGKLIFRKNQVYNLEQINLSEISTGTYFIRILSDIGNQQIKVMVK